MMTDEQHSRQTEHEAVDWLYIMLGTAIILSLVLGAVIGHHIVSLGVTP